MLYPPELRAQIFESIFYHRAEGSAKRGRSQSRVAWDVRAARIPLLALRAWMRGIPVQARRVSEGIRMGWKRGRNAETRAHLFLAPRFQDMRGRIRDGLFV